MSLIYDDLQSIRTIVVETVSPLNGDIKEIYQMLADD